MVVVATAVAVAHALAVWPRYHVGSFDDDSAYLYMASAIAHGTGLLGRLPNGWPVLRDYPAGYPALLAPLVALTGPGHGWLPERALSLACDAAIFPLTWQWLRPRVEASTAAAVLGLMALDPVLATWANMTTPELPYLVSLLLLLLAADRWARSPRLLPPSGAAAVVLAAGGVWLKEAGLGVAAGLIVWLAWRRWWGRAAIAAAGTALLLAPIVVLREAAGVPLAGARYASEISGYVSGGLLHKLVLIPVGVAQLAFYAVFEAVTPVFGPWVRSLPLLVVVSGLASISALALVAVGMRQWVRLLPGDPAAWLAGLYLVEVVTYRYVNERRTILVLPVLAAWWVVGARAAGTRWLHRAAAADGPRGAARRRWLAAGAAALLVVLAVQWRSDYLVRSAAGTTSRPLGSRYESLLAALGPRRAVVESDFEWTTALATDHPVAESAFGATYTACSPTAARAGLVTDRAAYGYTAALNALFVDDGCLARLALRSPWAVPLLQTRRDRATVWEVVGPGSVHPRLRGLAVVLAAGVPRVAGDTAVRTWRLPAGSVVTQVSLGAAGDAGPTRRVSVALEEGGRWREVVAAGGSVGTAAVPWLLRTLPAGTAASAVRVTVTGRGPASLTDLAVVGRAPA